MTAVRRSRACSGAPNGRYRIAPTRRNSGRAEKTELDNRIVLIDGRIERLQPEPGLPIEFVKPRKRGVEVGLVEKLEPVVRTPSNAGRRSPATRRRSRPGRSMALMGYDRPETVEPMHRLDVDLQGWREVPNRAEGLGLMVPGREWGRAAGGRRLPSPPRRKSSCRSNAA